MHDLLFRGVLIGIGATIAMDVWALLLALVPGEGRPNWAPVGRWFGHLARGTIFHEDIAIASEYPAELALGWAGHYAVGIIYGVVFALFMGDAWFAHPRFLPAWIWGIVTVAGGWFLLQPGLGIGWAASKLPNRNKVRVMNLVAHSFFALGLWGTAVLLR